MGSDDKNADSISDERLEQEIDAIFRTAEFERSPVMRRLLDFLIKRTREGQGEELKAYTVAVEGLGRDPDFDSQSDSYPRVQVGRLRKMLDAHYAHAPPHDAVRIYIKPGGYRVFFAMPEHASAGNWRSTDWEGRPSAGPLGRISSPSPQAAMISWRLAGVAACLLLAFGALVWIVQGSVSSSAPQRLAAQAPVLELAELRANSGEEAVTLATAVRTLLDDGLHRSWLMRVRDAAPGDPREYSEQDQVVYRLTGRADTSGVLSERQVVLTLTDVQSGDRIWSQSIALPRSGPPLSDALRPAIVTLIGPFGVIATHQRGLIQPVDQPGYACLLDFDRYFRYRDPALGIRVRDCVAKTVEREPMQATALAAASFLSVDPALTKQSADDVARAVDYARRAVAANPYSAEAQAADARVALMAGHCVRGQDLSRRALNLNPFNPELRGLVGYMLFACGDPSSVDLLRTAIAEDPDVPTFYSVALFLALMQNKDVPGALHVADTIRPPGTGMSGQYEVVQTLASAARGDIDGARKHWIKAHRALPSDADPDRVLRQYFYLQPIRQHILSYLRGSGIAS